MLPVDNNKINCTGCSACVAFCRHLMMVMDKEGFRYPHVDLLGCTDCGRCLNVCPMVEHSGNARNHLDPSTFDKKLLKSLPQTYAAWSSDEIVRSNSSSGGIFTLLAHQVIAAGGYVVGAAFDHEVQLRHIVVKSFEGLEALRGSKYIQSDTRSALLQVRNILNEGGQVLYSGTPCQVAGLYSFLGEATEGLLTCDLVCHGVPSEKVFRKYLAELETLQGCKVIAVSFRNKSVGWKRFSMSIVFENGHNYICALDKDSFMRIFLSDISLRPSCYYCPFSTIPRQGDISLADYWGVETVHPGIDDDFGVSLIIVNSLNGADIFRRISSSMICRQTDIFSAIAHNPCIVRPVRVNPNRDAFMLGLETHSLEKLIDIYLSTSVPVWRKALARVKKLIRMLINLKGKTLFAIT